MFSRRLPWPPRENRLSVLLRERRRRGTALLDLTESNPTRAGLNYPADRLAAALADRGVAAYEPDPRGLEAARRAVSAHCVRRGQATSSDRIVLTAGTSEAYALLFKLLADPGDVVLIPRPSYPLFDDLAALESVRVEPYAVLLDGGWRLDLEAIERRLEAGGERPPRAVFLVNPNNPTGTALSEEERRALGALCAPRGVPLISDEVFLDFRFEGTGAPVSMAGTRQSDEPRALSFTLGGLSKSCGLPQMKLGWILVDGPEAQAREALERLEFITDSYLSVGTPVQRAAADLLSIGEEIGAAIRERVLLNHASLRASVPDGSPCRLLPADGGWYAVLQVPAILSEEDRVLQLVEEDDVLVHPGYFFDFPREAFLILSLLPEPRILSEGVGRLLGRVGA
ncbi:MAG TPA: pyridoxal phosphate-dependent aminotransferase [Candidatus Cryosericum sp.]|nr:pyridoxal phosphate-dependent aminotransferase [Candidatus Cryosericum sp.]